MRVYVCVWVMSYESSNGIPSLMWGARPIRSPVNRENVSHDLKGLEQVYDIISALPKQRYGAEEPPTVWSIHKVSSRANSHKMLEHDFFLSASFFPKQNETLQNGEAAWRAVLNSIKKVHTEKPNRKPTSVLWVRHRDTGYRHFSLVFSLWQGLCYLSGATFGANPSKLAIRTGRSQGINTSIHPSPHTHIKTLKNMQVCANTHLGVHTKEPADVHSGHSNPESRSWFLNIWLSVEMREAELMEMMFHSPSGD